MANAEGGWKDADIQRILAVLKDGKPSRSLFYTLPVAVFTDVAETMDENAEQEQENTVINPIIEQNSPSFDLFGDKELANWEQGALPDDVSGQNLNVVTHLEPGQFLAALEDDEFAESWSFPDLLSAADKAGVLSDEHFMEILANFVQKQNSNPKEERKSTVLALITARLSQASDISRDNFSAVLSTCSSSEEKCTVLLNVWSDMFKALVSHGRLGNPSTTQHFLDLFKKRLQAKRENPGILLNIVTEDVEGWTEQVIAFLAALFKMLADEDHDKTQPFLREINEFDLTKLIHALLQMITSQNLRQIAASESFFNLLKLLNRYFPSFIQKSGEFTKIVTELITMSRKGECSEISSMQYRLLQNFAAKSLSTTN